MKSGSTSESRISGAEKGGKMNQALDPLTSFLMLMFVLSAVFLVLAVAAAIAEQLDRWRKK